MVIYLSQLNKDIYRPKEVSDMIGMSLRNFQQHMSDNKIKTYALESEHIDDKSLSEELADDIISIIHPFSGKLYGMCKKVKAKAIKELADNDESKN